MLVLPRALLLRSFLAHKAASDFTLRSPRSCSSSAMASVVEEPSVAVIGAGVAGLACASSLAERGARVTVFETGRGPGGRMSQRRERTPDGSQLLFDHGAQYFTLKDPAVQGLLDKWKAAGIAAEWEGKFGSLEFGTGRFTAETDEGRKRYVGVPGMNSICKAMSQQAGVQALYGVQVTSLSWTEDGGGYWALSSKDSKPLGTFRGVVVADKGLASQRFTALTGLPPPLEAAGVETVSKTVGSVQSAPCFAVMLAFSTGLQSIPLDGFSVLGSNVLSWASRDSSKPGRPNDHRECWVLHSTAEYAEAVIRYAGFSKPSEELLSNVATDLFKEFQAAIPDVPAPFFIKAHRWGSAFPLSAISPREKCIMEEGKRLVVCGDFCVGPRVESAILSGLAAAETLLKLIKPSQKL